MTSKEFTISIQECSKFLNAIALEKLLINQTSLKVNKDFNSVNLDKDATYREIYLRGLQLQHYNLILEDYSYFQFSISIENTNPTVRYSYYPNPFNTKDEDLNLYSIWYEEGSLSFEDYSQAISEYDENIKIPMVRYDLSYKQFERILHPTAHIHMGNAENSRIATDKIFSPLLFILFIVKVYYHDYWEKYSFEENSYKLDEILKKEKLKCKFVSESEDIYFCELQSKLINLI